MSKGEKIIQIAKQLFLEKGYAKVSVSEITNALEISKGSFYTYFPSKTDMVLEIIREKKEITKQRYRTIQESSSSFEENLEKFLWNYFQRDSFQLEIELVIVNLMMNWDILEEGVIQALLDCEQEAVSYWKQEFTRYAEELCILPEERAEYAVFLTKLINGFILFNLFVSEECSMFTKNVDCLVQKIETKDFEEKIKFLIKNIMKMLRR